MDGLLSGLTSIVPILPDQNTITRSMQKPPVEIMPLPSDGTMTENASADLLGKPYTLSLDIKGEGGAGKNGSSPARAASEEAPAGDLLGGAYKLSLGSEEAEPLTQAAARELSRMQEYELLGKNMTRRPQQVHPETGVKEAAESFQNNSAGDDLIGEKVRSLLSQSAVVERQIPDQPAPPTSGLVEAPSPQPEGAPLLKTATVQFTAADIEAILTLDPELQETFMNMFGNVRLTQPADGAEGVRGPVTEYAPPATEGANTPLPEGTAPSTENVRFSVAENATPGVESAKAEQWFAAQNAPDNAKELNTLPPAVRDAWAVLLKEMPVQHHKGQLKQLAEMYGGMAAAEFTDEEFIKLATQVLAGMKAQNEVAAARRGDILNLSKIHELPYSLYLFGNVKAETKGTGDDGADLTIEENNKAALKAPQLYLHLSEAVKMASVLHNIYYGGSGHFPEETPWYAPYVRYALKNGIIKNGEFTDYNEFATRAETAHIFSGSVPEAELPVINYIYDLPDVSETIGYGGAVYRLFRAGVLVRKDKHDSFHPDSLLTKTEAAAIIGRIATPDDRKRVI